MSNFDTIENAIESLAEVYYGKKYEFTHTYDTDKDGNRRWQETEKKYMFLYYKGTHEDEEDDSELHVIINPNMEYDENCRMYLNVLKKRIHERIHDLNKVLMDCFMIEDM